MRSAQVGLVSKYTSRNTIVSDATLRRTFRLIKNTVWVIYREPDSPFNDCFLYVPDSIWYMYSLLTIRPHHLQMKTFRYLT